jgi:hypothetical protein
MATTITLELPDEVARRAQAVAERTGRPLGEVLADWLGQAAALDAANLHPEAIQPIFTPYGNEAAAQSLLDALADDDSERSNTGRS